MPERGAWFQRLGTLPAYANSSPDDVASAEIAAATGDGRTLVHTDSPGGRLGLVELDRLGRPRPAGTIAVPGEPTSVDVLGHLALTVVDTSASFTDPSGVLQVLDLRSRQVVATHDLRGQPDSVDLSPDGRYAAVAIENERDEDVNDGQLPQLPGGHLAVVDLAGQPPDWTVRRVELTGLAALAPEDPEPEYVSVNRRNQAVVTLQENNHIAVVDLRKVRSSTTSRPARRRWRASTPWRTARSGWTGPSPRPASPTGWPGSTTTTWPPPTRATSKGAAAPGRCSTAAPGRWCSPRAPSWSGSPSATASTPSSGPRTRASSPRASRWPPTG